MCCIAAAVAAPQYQQRGQQYEERVVQYEVPQISQAEWDRLNPIKQGESYDLDQLRKEWSKFLP